MAIGQHSLVHRKMLKPLCKLYAGKYYINHVMCRHLRLQCYQFCSTVTKMGLNFIDFPPIVYHLVLPKNKNIKYKINKEEKEEEKCHNHDIF